MYEVPKEGSVNRKEGGKKTERKTTEEKTTSCGAAHPCSPLEEAKCSGWPGDTRCPRHAAWDRSPFYFCWYRRKQPWKPVLATALGCQNKASSACLWVKSNTWTHSLLNHGGSVNNFPPSTSCLVLRYIPD